MISDAEVAGLLAVIAGTVWFCVQIAKFAKAAEPTEPEDEE